MATIKQACLNSCFALKMSSPSRLLKGRPTVPLPSQYVSKLLDGSPHSCPSLQPASPASQKHYLDNLLAKIMKLTLATDTVQEDVFQVIEAAVKRLLNADRASLFILDDQSQELYASVFSVNDEESTRVDKVLLNQEYPISLSNYIENLGKRPIDIVAYKGKKIRLSLSKGIAGYVARTGNVMNVTDTNKSDHFCAEFDQLTGYTTETLLCVPLLANGKTMGVLEAVNKIGSHFSETDEQLLQSIALACSLYMSHSYLSRECRRLENKCRVSNEMLQYHRQCSPEHFESVKANAPQTITQYNIESFNCFTKPIPDDVKAHLVVTMIADLVESSLFNSQQLLKFAVTVSKNYRPEPYHNWDHAFHVAQCMYCILKGAPTHFSDVEKFTLVIAALCHDLDHRGFNNGFFVFTNHPLSQLYCSSVLENHHFGQTIELLQIDGLNVFSLFTDAQYNIAIETMQKAIIATDLANFFPNKNELSSIVEAGKFSWEIPQHKELIMCLMMTACDLCGVCKPWDAHTVYVEVIYEEFFAQGQMEKSIGLKSMDMMDINSKQKIPEFQVDFIQNITQPCLQLLVTALPHMNVMLYTTTENKAKWQDIIDQKQSETPV